jgi:cytoskeleton protein RodZ
LKDSEGINAPFRSPSDAAPPSWVLRLRQPVPLIVIALLVGAVVIAVVPMRLHDEAATPAATSPAPAAVPVATGAAPPAPAASAPTGAVPAAATPVTATAAESAADKPAGPASASATAAVSPASGVVVFRAKGESWVEVVDAKGAVALRKLMVSGESAGASGELPLRVTIGRVDMTEMQVRGKPFDLKTVSRDNVARFQVK